MAIACMAFGACSPTREPGFLTDTEFSSLIESFSESARSFRPGNGYESENWLSNERSFQQVIPGLPHHGNGAYIGVGPEQNFTYISVLQPRIAFIVDIRRENRALHLFYKALFELSDDRAAFVSRLFCRGPVHGTADESARELLAAVEAAAPSGVIARDTVAAILERLVRDHRLPLTEKDRAAIASVTMEFCSHGPAARWSTGDQGWIPTYAELMLETGRDGRPHSFLASEDRFQAVKSIQQRNLIVPVVGDFGGTRAFARIGEYLRDHQLLIDVVYVSNVRPYLRGDALRQFEANLAALPADEQSVLIETRFRTLEARSVKPEFETQTYTRSILQLREHAADSPE